MNAIRTTSRPSAPIKWHGGKTYLAARIIELMPDHTHYVEPFFGGGAVFFRKPIGKVEEHSEIINDLYGELANFWKVLKSKRHFKEFQRQVSLTPFSKPVWEDAMHSTQKTMVDRACAFFIRYRQSRQGLGRDFATMSRSRTRRGMNEQVSSWLSAIDGLEEAHERLKRVVIYSEPACDVIAREDSVDTFFYCDPPYLKETRAVPNAYSFEMSNDEHERLLDALGSTKGKFLLSGYPSDTYDKAANRFGWNRTDTKIDNKASSKKVKQIKTECLWSNY